MDEDPQIGFLRADVVRFCASLDDALAPAQRLRLVRRIGQVVGLSHEEVRYLMADDPARDDASGAEES